jgi:thiol:disulfide interchange protein DsbA
MLEAWLKKLPADVNFRRVPVAFREEPFAQHQKIFYTLEALGKVDELHRKVFHAIHVERQRLDKPADIAAWMGKNGVDPAKYNEMSNSFAVQTKLRQAKQLAEAYKIDGVPAIGIHGRYYTSGSLAGGNEQMLSVTNFLIGRLRKA